MSSSNDFKTLGKSKGQNLQNLIKLNVLQSLDGRGHNGSEHIPFVQPEKSIHTIAANKEKKTHDWWQLPNIFMIDYDWWPLPNIFTNLALGSIGKAGLSCRCNWQEYW